MRKCFFFFDNSLFTLFFFIVNIIILLTSDSFSGIVIISVPLCQGKPVKNACLKKKNVCLVIAFLQGKRLSISIFAK